MELTSEKVALLLKGKHIGTPQRFRSACIDSRQVEEGSLFVALKGSRHDGHDFVMQALQKGCVGALVEREVPIPEGKFLIVVDNTLRALQKLAKYKRENFSGTVVGIAGSAGKTTTKEMIAFLLSKVGKTCKTPRNLNSQVGVPLSVINFDSDCEYWVVEMGASQKGDVRRLVQIVKPSVRVITSIGEEHLETFGCLDDVVLGNGEIFSDMHEEDIGVVPSYVYECYKDYKVITFGDGSEFEARDVSLSLEGVSFNVQGVRIFIPIPSFAVVENALCSLATIKAMGLDWKKLAENLSQFKPVEGRFRVIKAGPNTLIDDSYNANPPSVRMALKTLSRLPGKRMAVLGDMLELGSDSERYHREIGSLCAELGIDECVFYGKEMFYAYQECKRLKQECYHFDEEDELLSLIKGKYGWIILFKGSRGMRMERFIERLLNDWHFSI
ncbi:UDP-N-acetylmuramoyl-tripeptide--D-alanyl-D-alanine ligase [Thermocrinis minervae]|uniref:UDP-N-acetylmuramoyl-tripeptide--D-alanyl-D-alanine ligase n=1 Tax=Thermocrinis minervae TaxID=381751 RepID=A0A1M6QKR4_9AQUI|nr:UDP-N-acetylmuramoyl-tripeptide--D-alanyl-D-alanine ligase [Thermocrinis minervae]SHK20842.1 UDP-N-acetylmuramoyl-tripeptide--D-alanyl-D-alanine ligase [Thermocrinis minervae]